jgi:error-prone DNA polymerase
MRTHYPAEFFASVLNSQPMGFFSPRTLVNEARRVGIVVLSPDIHLSGKGFTVEDGGAAIRVGLSYCEGLSGRAIVSILRERRTAPFASVADVYQRTAVERDSLENLIRGGYTDCLSSSGPTASRGRARLLDGARRLPSKRGSDGQPEIPAHPASWWFSSLGTGSQVEYLPSSSEAAEKDEWSVLGLNVTGHPLKPHRKALESLGAAPADDVYRLPHRTRARVAGFLECLQRPPTRSGAVVHFLLVEDESGVLQATIFEDVYKKYGHVLHESGAYLLDGVVEHDPRRGSSYLVSTIRSLGDVLDSRRATVPGTPEAAPAGSGAFVRAKRRGRRAG